MKRSEMLKLIANQLNFLNGTFDGLKDVFTEVELAKADVILTTIEEAGMLPPTSKITKSIDAEMPALGKGKFNYEIETNEWDPE